MRSKIKAHHVAIVAVCTIVVFVLSFELGKLVHRPASTPPRLYHGYTDRHVRSQGRYDQWLLALVGNNDSRP
jgi:hypothetical protein